MGKPIKGAMDEILKEREKQENQIPQKSQTQINAPNLDGFIYVPSVDLYFQKEKQFNGSTWVQADKELRRQNLRMPTIEEFRQFLIYLKQNQSNKNGRIYEDIIEAKGISHAEWLEAFFEKRTKHLRSEMYMYYTGGFHSEKLEDCLMKKNGYGVDIDEWLNDATKQGLPKPNIKKGSLYYLSPQNNTVAGFHITSGEAILNCHMNPSISDVSIGVRGVLEGAGAKTK
ncbi:MAG: hypothetical protein WC475_04240 [Candidatus Paceibacterota bacterium]